MEANSIQKTNEEKISTSRVVLVFLFIIGGLWLSSLQNSFLAVLGILLTVVGIFLPPVQKLSRPTGATVKKVIDQAVEAIAETIEEIFAPLGTRSLREFQIMMGLKGGDHIAFLVFSQGPAYLGWLLDFVETGARDPGIRELVVFLAKDETELGEVVENNPSLQNFPNLVMRTLSGLPSGSSQDFFANIKPWVDELVKEISANNKGEKFQAIRLITSDLEPLYQRMDFVTIKKNFNRKFEQFLATYEYLRNVPFFSMGTYKPSTFVDLAGKPLPNISREMRLILSDHNVEKTLVLTKDSELLTGNDALRYLLESDALWQRESIVEEAEV